MSKFDLKRFKDGDLVTYNGRDYKYVGSSKGTSTDLLVVEDVSARGLHYATLDGRLHSSRGGGLEMKPKKRTVYVNIKKTNSGPLVSALFDDRLQAMDAGLGVWSDVPGVLYVAIAVPVEIEE